MTDALISNAVLTSLSLTLLHFLWQGFLIALVLKTVLVLLPQTRSQTRYLLSCSALITSLIAPIVTFYLLYQPETLHGQMNQLTGVLNEFPAKLNLQSPESYSGILPWLSISWMICVSFLSVKLVLDFVGVTQLKSRHVIEPPRELAARFDILVGQLAVTSKPKLLISLKARVPMAVGWLKPVVLLPAQMVTGLNEDQLDMLLLHELAHIKRYDYLVNLFQSVIELLLFFHPSVKWISKQIRVEREFCSDDIAIEHCGNPIAYAHTLTDTATICRHNIPNMAMAASGGDLKQRVVRIVNHHCSSAKNKSSFYAAAFVVLVLMATVINQIVNSKVIDITAASIQFFNPAPISEEKSEINKADVKSQLALFVDDTREKQTQLTIGEPITLPSHQLLAAVTTDFDTEENALESTNIALASNDATASVEKSYQRTTNIAPTKIEDNQHEDIAATSAIASASLDTQPELQKSTAEISYSEKTTEAMLEPTEQIVLAKQEKTSTTKRYQEEFVFKGTSADTLTLAKLEDKSSTANRLNPELLADLITPMDFYDDVSPSKTQVTASNKKTRAAEVIKSYQPKYPEIAKRKGLETEIRVTFVVDKNGRVRDLNFDTFKKHVYFRRAVKSAMKKWRFKPATKNGRPVESTVSKIFSFNLIS